jgi:hypothetical protein
MFNHSDVDFEVKFGHRKHRKWIIMYLSRISAILKFIENGSMNSRVSSAAGALKPSRKSRS